MPESTEQEKQYRTLQIIVGASACGVVLFGIVTLFLPPSGPAVSQGLPWALLVMTVAAISVYALIGIRGSHRTARLVEKGAHDSAARAMKSLQTIVIIRAAIAEAVGLFAGVVHLLTGNRLYLIVMALSVVGILLALPGRDRHENVWSDLLRHRESAGLCSSCGYDLRGSDESCPECGRAISPSRAGR